MYQGPNLYNQCKLIHKIYKECFTHNITGQVFLFFTNRVLIEVYLNLTLQVYYYCTAIQKYCETIKIYFVSALCPRFISKELFCSSFWCCHCFFQVCWLVNSASPPALARAETPCTRWWNEPAARDMSGAVSPYPSSEELLSFVTVSCIGPSPQPAWPLKAVPLLCLGHSLLQEGRHYLLFLIFSPPFLLRVRSMHGWTAYYSNTREGRHSISLGALRGTWQHRLVSTIFSQWIPCN